tara:strand:+ start:5293 stop:6435 length:1143 start_codon:yes stop_codon:yes gene_type:complete
MPLTVSTLSTNLQNAYNAGKPILLSKNILAGQETSDVTDGLGPETGISAVWRNGRGKAILLPEDLATTSFAKATDLAQCPLRAFDHNLSGMTAPWSSSFQSDAPASFFYCLGDPTTAFDSVVIANHNFKDIQLAISEQDVSAKLFVELYVSDARTFTTGSTTTRKLVRWEAGTTPGFSAFTNKRLVCLDLGTSGSQLGGQPAGYLGKFNVISGGSFFQLVIGVDSTSVTFIPSPQIGELFVGPRRQLSRNPTFGTALDIVQIESDISNFSSRSGVQTRYGLSLGKSVFNPTFITEGDADQGTTDLYSLNDLETLEQFWQDTQYGANGFFLIPSPGSSPTIDAPFCVVSQAEFPAQLQSGLTERDISFEFEETPPYTREEV